MFSLCFIRSPGFQACRNGPAPYFRDIENTGAVMKRILLVCAAMASCGFGAWSMLVASRYQALCEISYFSATAAEIKHCDERLSELGGR